jgi:hypothetical protein
MDFVSITEVGSLITGAASAVCWIVAAVVKVDPPESLRGKPDGDYWDGIVVNGADLICTLRAQARWNSAAAISAAIAVLIQVSSKLLQ